MAELTPRDKRAIRLAAIGISLYLALFYGVRGFLHLEKSRGEYRQLLDEAQTMQVELRRYENKWLLIEKLQKNSNLDFSKLSRATLVSQASAAIQQAAKSSRIKLGPIRESPGSPAAYELASMRLEATGPVTATMTLLYELGTLGYPLIVDSVQIDADSKKPGMVTLVLRVVLLDYEQWKTKEAKRNA